MKIFISHTHMKVLKILIKNDSNLQLLNYKLEEIMMTDNKFYAQLNDLVNSSCTIWKRILDNRFVRKIMKYLFERFRPKENVIKERKGLDSMKVKELIYKDLFSATSFHYLNLEGKTCP